MKGAWCDYGTFMFTRGFWQYTHNIPTVTSLLCYYI